MLVKDSNYLEALSRTGIVVFDKVGTLTQGVFEVNGIHVFAIGVKLICLLLGAIGIASMWLAIFADVGVMIIAVLNAIHTLFVKKL